MPNIYFRLLPNRHLSDLNPLFCGEEECRPMHTFGPAVRDHVIIHFVTSGCGIYNREGTEYTVHAGQAFIIMPREITVYSADKDTPWHYKWVAFDGTLSSRFADLGPIIDFSTNWAEEILQLDRESNTLEYMAASKLFMMYAEFFSLRKPKHDYAKAVRDYVNVRYIHHISVEEIAEHLSLDRRYLSRIFKKKTGKTIQEYIVSVRINKAKQLLEDGHNISEAAMLCGYEDACNFSKMFKKQTGISPGKWKERAKSCN